MMMLARITPVSASFDIRTFACPTCDGVHRRALALADPMKSRKQRLAPGRMASADVNVTPCEAASWYPKALPGVEKDLRSHLSTCACTHAVAARSEEPRHGSIELTAPHCGEIRKAVGTKTRSSGACMEAGKARRPQHDRSRGARCPSSQAGETDERSGGLRTT
jgi:hypothetical protein